MNNYMSESPRELTFDDYARINAFGRFQRIWVYPFSDAVKGLGEAQFKCCLYLLSARNKKGYITETLDSIAAATKLSKDTVSSTISHLIGNNLIARVKSGVLMMNPLIVYSSSDTKRRRDYARFRNIQIRNGRTNDDNVIYVDDGTFLYDAKTGEILDGIEMPKGESFVKVWMSPFVQSLSGLGREQISVCLYLLRHLCTSGRVYTTRERLAKSCNVAIGTERTTLQRLEERDFLRREKRGSIMVNPSIVCFDVCYNRGVLQRAYQEIPNKYIEQKIA